MDSLPSSSLSSTTTTSMTDAEKEAYAEKVEEKLRVRMIKIAHYDRCVLIEIAATLALNQFQKKYTRAMINRSTLLQEEEDRLIAAKTKAWNDRFAAESDAYPPTLESILWIVAKSGFTREVAPLMNLSKATRECKNLQRYMREVMYRGMTQLYYYCWKGMTSSVVRMLGIRSIDVETREGGIVDEKTCLMTAAQNGHLEICRLLLDKGAQLEAIDDIGCTPLLIAAYLGYDEIVCLFCDRGANVESCITGGWMTGCRPLNYAAWHGHISIVKELIEKRNAEINAREGNGETALAFASQVGSAEIAAYLVSRGGIV